jgi:hypothetical protein
MHSLSAGFSNHNSIVKYRNLLMASFYCDALLLLSAKSIYDFAGFWAQVTISNFGPRSCSRGLNTIRFLQVCL